MKTILKKTLELDGFSLKMIAIITMLIDHIGAGILEVLLASHYPNQAFSLFAATKDYPLLATTDIIFRLIGRIAFPIFCFFLVEGFLHTKNVKKYAMRLLFFGLLSEIPFNLLVSTQIKDSTHQNVYFTLLFGLLCMILFEEIQKAFTNTIVVKVLQCSSIILVAVLAELLHTDYGAIGVLAIIAMYTYHKQYGYKTSMAMGTFLLTISNLFEVTSLFNILLIRYYNGKRGRSIKYFFYAFYPLHLLLLSLICYFIR